MTNEEFYNQFKIHANKLGLNTSDTTPYKQRQVISFLMDPDKDNRWLWEFHPGDNQRIAISWHVGDKFYHDWCDLAAFLAIDQRIINTFLVKNREANMVLEALKLQVKAVPADHKLFVKSLVGR
jgi:hypothetical protein